MYLEDLERVRVGAEISPALNGGNFVATTNSAEPNDPFFNVADSLSLSSIRFPGGDLTERYLSPSGDLWHSWVTSQDATITLPDGRQIATLKSFLSHASEESLQISFVIPTEGLLVRHSDGSLDIDQDALNNVVGLVDGMISGNYGPLDIRHFEVGNEYYVNGRLTAEEYGFIANEIVNRLSETFKNFSEDDESIFFDAPGIAVQAGPPWLEGDNQTIIESLDEAARSAIDGVIIHWYPRNLDQIGNLDRSFASVEQWERADGFSNLDLHVTEWNVHSGSHADTGIYQASTLLEAYERMVSFDVDSADIWGVEFQKLVTGLAHPRDVGISADESMNYILTPAGEIIRSLYHTTPGLNSLDLKIDDVLYNSSEIGIEGLDYTLTSFGDLDRAIVYLGNRSDLDISSQFDQGGYFSRAHYISVQKFSLFDDPTTSGDESVPENAPYLHIQTSTYRHEQFTDLVIDLGPGEIARVEYVLGEAGVSIEGQVGAQISGMSYDDHIFGTDYADTLVGNQGNDCLDGSGGQDLIYGGSGNDTLVGGVQSDFMDGGADDDRLFGGSGLDVVFGGEGDDVVDGGDGSDLLFGGEGKNTLLGGAGDDVIISTGTDDNLDGGQGADIYSVSTSGNTIIDGWSFDQGDLISFQGQYTEPGDVRDRIVEITYDDGRPGDLVIEHDSGAQTVVMGAAGQQESLLASLLDHQPLGESTLLQANLLSTLAPSQVSALTNALNTEAYAAYRELIDPALLAQNLDGERLAHFLNGLGAFDADQFLSDIPIEIRHELLEEMQGAELNDFLSELEYEPMLALLRSVDSSTFRDVSLSFDDDTRGHVEGLLARFSIDHAEHEDQPEGSALSDIHNLLPVEDGGLHPPDNPDDSDQQHETPFLDASCFIATAVYADADHPDVWLLRWFRDEVLRRYLLGRLFIASYWKFGPPLAEVVSRNTVLVRTFYAIVRLCVLLVCAYFNRETGKQPDHQDHSCSRLIRVGLAARSFRSGRALLQDSDRREFRSWALSEEIKLERGRSRK